MSDARFDPAETTIARGDEARPFAAAAPNVALVDLDRYRVPVGERVF